MRLRSWSCQLPGVGRWGYVTPATRPLQWLRSLSSLRRRDSRPSGIRSTTPSVSRPIVPLPRFPCQRGGIAACRRLQHVSALAGVIGYAGARTMRCDTVLIRACACALAIGQGNGERDAELLTDAPGDVPVASQVFSYQDVAGGEPSLGTVSCLEFRQS